MNSFLTEGKASGSFARLRRRPLSGRSALPPRLDETARTPRRHHRRALLRAAGVVLLQHPPLRQVRPERADGIHG